jgi:hypothetical protein
VALTGIGMDELDRFFHRLVRSLAERGADRLEQPLQVAEVYQELVPYRQHRGELNLDTHQDYEMVVLRLLAGERGYARLEPEDAQRALAQEASAPFPETGAFRRFAAARVHLNPEAVGRVLAGDLAYAPPEAARQPEGETAAAGRPDLTPREAVAAPDVKPQPAPGARPAFSFQPAAEQPCPYCGAALPAGREVYYCPFCGGNVKGVRCPECQTELEMGWLYCITCGRKMTRD